MTSFFQYLRWSLLLLLGLFLHSAHAQTGPFTRRSAVGLGVRVPTEMLDVNGTVRIESLPRYGEHRIYRGTNTPDRPYYPNQIVVVDKHGVLGRMDKVPQWIFYMPPILLPLCREMCEHERSLGRYTDEGTATTDGRFIVDLYQNYREQLGMTQATSQARPTSYSSQSLPVRELWNKEQLMFFVTYYDPNYFEDVVVDDDGVLSYRVKKNVDPTEKTYMSIVFRVKS